MTCDEISLRLSYGWHMAFPLLEAAEGHFGGWLSSRHVCVACFTIVCHYYQVLCQQQGGLLLSGALGSIFGVTQCHLAHYQTPLDAT